MKNNSFERNPVQELPNGIVARVFPFHVSLEGRETRILCRDTEDYDSFVKIAVVCTRRKNVILVTYSVVSNHGHFVVLCTCKKAADDFGEEVKRVYSMYFQRKYHESRATKGMDVDSQWLDSDWYLRNAIAYDIRNAMDNGADSILEYEWTSFRAYFSQRRTDSEDRLVCSLSKSQKRALMHTNDTMEGARWLVSGKGKIVPYSVCNYRYVEGAFNNSQTLFLQKIGNVNVAEMSEKLIESPHRFKKDEDVVRAAGDICRKWFSCEIHDLPVVRKCRLISYYFQSNRTSVSQLARVFELPKDTVAEILRKNGLQSRGKGGRGTGKSGV